MTAPIAPVAQVPQAAPVAAAPVAQAPQAAPVAAAPVAQAAAPVAAAPVAQAPQTAPVAQAPQTAAPAAAPVAQAPQTAPAAAPAGPVGLPAGFGGLGAPMIGGVAGASSKLPDEHFGKPILFWIKSVEQRRSKYNNQDGSAKFEDVPTVDYIVFDPAVGTCTEHRGVTIWSGQISPTLATSYRAGQQALVAVALSKPNDKGNNLLCLDPITVENTGFTQDQMITYLGQVAADQYHWWPAAA